MNFLKCITSPLKRTAQAFLNRPSLRTTARHCRIHALSILAVSFALASCGEPGPLAETRVKPGVDTLLQWQDIVFLAPADALPEGMRVALHTKPASDLDDDVMGKAKLTISDVVTISFQGGASARTAYSVQIPVEQVQDGAVAVMLRTVGGMETDGVIDSGWVPSYGTYDEASASYTVVLGATAQTVSMVVYTLPMRQPDDARLNLNERPEIAWSRYLKPLSVIPSAQAKVQPLHAQAIVRAQTLVTGHSFALRCDPSKFRKNSICQHNSPQLKALANSAIEAAAILDNMGFKYLIMRTETLQSMRAVGDVAVPADSNDTGTDSSRYYPIEMLPALEDDDSGYYSPTDHTIRVSAGIDSLTIIHEIMHAVQLAAIPNFWEADWVIEGVADALEPFAPGYRGPRGASYRTGDWRDWEVELSHQNENKRYEYKVSEFWLSVDPLLRYMSALYNAVGKKSGEVSSPEDYSLIDQGLRTAKRPHLDDAYTELIRTRSKQTEDGYRHCHKEKMTCSDKECPVSDVRPFRFKPMSATCLTVESKIEADDCDNPVLQLELDGDQEKHRFVVDGQLYQVGETPTVKEDFELWVINLARTAKDNAKSEALLKPTCPGPVSILGQDHQLITSASSCEPRANNVCDLHERNRGFVYDSDLLAGTSRETTWDHELRGDRKVREDSNPIIAGERFLRDFEVSVAGGSRARASLMTKTGIDGDEFVISGHFDLAAKHAQGGGWGGTASAEAGYSITVVIGEPSTVVIKGCQWFDITSGTMMPVESGGARCEYASPFNAEDMAILSDTDYGSVEGMLNAEQRDMLRSFPLGDTIHFSLHALSFSSAEKVTGEQEGQFEIRIQFD